MTVGKSRRLEDKKLTNTTIVRETRESELIWMVNASSGLFVHGVLANKKEKKQYIIYFFWR
jgi:hypothetical protein